MTDISSLYLASCSEAQDFEAQDFEALSSEALSILKSRVLLHAGSPDASGVPACRKFGICVYL